MSPGAYVEAARPRTLVAGVVPVVVGTAAATHLIASRFVAALIVGVAIQIGVNYANDYFDGVKGIDTEARVGPRRAVASGLIAPARMKGAVCAALGVAALAGVYLALAVDPWLLAVGALSFAAALGYSGGPRPYASAGLGEIFVFVFFGLVATAGSFYVQDERVTALALVVSIPVGLLAVAILVANNLRDLAGDAVAGKRTLAVRLGAQRTHVVFDACALGALMALIPIALLDQSPEPLVALLSAPFLWRAHRELGGAGALITAARSQLVFGALLAAGLWIS